MSLIIETTIDCDKCFIRFEEGNRNLSGTIQRKIAKTFGWIYVANKDYCPKCRAVKKNGEYPKSHNRNRIKNSAA